MWIILFLFILLLSTIGYVMLTNYNVQQLYRKSKIKNNLIMPLKQEVKGKYQPYAYYSNSHKIVLPGQYKGFSYHHRTNFSLCYNALKFRTQFADMELFFSLIKEGTKFVEVLNVRIFPYEKTIKSEGNVEKNYSRLSIFTNNKYLTELLEHDPVKDHLKWLLRYNGDILLISKNNLHFKAFLDPKNLSVERVLDIIKALHFISTHIYKKENISY